ncbi:serine hydrolase domain-containing protein [Rhodopirellula sp. MGV]|uniref:serine hydrolase domain-containing protein n=1 Tax=Rhodopirellula sp. MGV TaxID=2023130 RepID=UPI000B9695E7|nr:serine hydrolase domain-containing protein [Rhodopirellula sp. MGV]OYP29518.1 hypothetical protein CGZ80_24320 [Rhodopirellula sp. MGV]PNY35293.1 hypothetical protein C2E31_18940 [Rhodopirellula baltica]
MPSHNTKRLLAAVLLTAACGVIVSQLRSDQQVEDVQADEIVLAETDLADTANTHDWLEQLATAYYPSLAVVVIRDGKVVIQDVFGVEDKQTGKPVTLQTQYHVASVTKVFTASIALMLHDQGVVNLDHTVTRYLPADISISNTPVVGATITLRQLASHTSGLPRSIPGPVQTASGRYELRPALLYPQLAKVKLEFQPGTDEAYSNLGFGLLGHVLERSTQKSLDELIQEMICQPLQLTGTGIEGNPRLHPATGYKPKSRGGDPESHSLATRLAGSGGLIASADDLAKFLISQMQPGPFSEQQLQQFRTATPLADGTSSRNTLGWSINASLGVGRCLEKNGGRGNCRAWIGYSIDHQVGVVMLTNCGGPSLDPFGRRLLEHSVPIENRRLVTDDGYAKLAPFTGVRWQNDLPIVRIVDEWMPLLSIDGTSTDQIMTFAKKQFGKQAQKRFAEDLVEVLSKMGQVPKPIVTLELESQPGTLETRTVRMTYANCDRLWHESNAD